jgi:predicted ATPase
MNILVTSREALRVEGERVQRLAPLKVPFNSSGLSAADALTFPAVQLFVERASATSDTFELTDTEAPVVADICRRLDGVPLAVALAAGRVDAFGVRGVAARLDDRLRLLTHGNRTALPRHQTLKATLDWSFELLPEVERIALRRLAILAGNFTFETAAAIMSGDGISLPDAAELVGNLVSKSLVSASIAGDVVYYRLLDTMRAYARDKLTESGEFDKVARQHGVYFCNFFSNAEAELSTRAASEWSAFYGLQLDNARSALDWAFSAGGDATLGVGVTVAVSPLWALLSLNEECRSRVELALSILNTEPSREDRRRMQLFAALGCALLYTKGVGPEATSAWTNTLAIAERIHDTDYQLRALRGLWADTINRGDHRAALEFAERFERVATTSANPDDALVGARLTAIVLNFLGQHKAARIRLERVLSRFTGTATTSYMIRFQFDQRVFTRTTLSRILWLQGAPKQAARMAESNVAEALALDHIISLTFALAESACWIAINNGDLAAAERYVTTLLQQAKRDALGPWELWGRCFRGVLLARQKDFVAAIQSLAPALETFPKNSFHMRYTSFLGELAYAWSRTGESAKAREAIDNALEIADRHDERWGFAELLRIQGTILLREDAAGGVAATERCFLQSLDWARRQEALSWELRTATSLARLRDGDGRVSEARDALRSVYNRFTEGFDTVDLRTARSLLYDLEGK